MFETILEERRSVFDVAPPVETLTINSPMGPFGQTPVIYLWDFESFSLNDDQLRPTIRHIRNTINSKLGKNSEKAFLVCCDVRNLSQRTTKALNKIRNIDVVHADTGDQNGADEKIKQKLHQFDIDYRDQPGVIVLISGNNDFSYFLSNVSRSGWQVVLFHPDKVNKEMLDCVDLHFNMRDIVARVKNDQKTTQQESPQPECDPSHLLITNLVSELSTERLLNTITNTTSQYNGHVQYINRLTGEAVLTYQANEHESRGAAALLISKSCRNQLKKQDLNVLAIKDPSSELGRMKFTVQQVAAPPLQKYNGRMSADASDMMSLLFSSSSGVGSLSPPDKRNTTSPTPPPEQKERQRGEEQRQDEEEEEGGEGEPHEEVYYDSDGVCCVASYASAVKKPPRTGNRPSTPQDWETESKQIVTNSFRPYFHKPAMQCFHWDNPNHLNQGIYDCKFWHPRERCRFYPSCMMGAESCGYAHPFCGLVCECDQNIRDPQMNHRLKAPSYMRLGQSEQV